MKREELKKLLGESATDEVIDKIMGMNGADIEAQKKKATDAETERDQLKTQLTEANTTIEGFKKLKPEELQAAADDYKAKWEQAQEESKNQLAQLKFDHALEGALTNAKARNPKAVRALLQQDLLKLGEDGSIAGLKEQLEKIKADADYLFEPEEGTPELMARTSNTKITKDAFDTALERGLNRSLGIVEQSQEN